MYRFLLLLFICLLGVSDLDALAQTVPDSLAVSRVAVWDEGPVNYRTPPTSRLSSGKQILIISMTGGKAQIS